MWKKGNTWAVGGLREIGFKRSTDYLLVLSSNGRGIFDCLNDRKVSRDTTDYYYEKWDSHTGFVEGFGVLTNEKIKCGGFEHPDPINKSINNWSVEIVKEFRPDWKKKRLYIEVLFLINMSEKSKIKVTDLPYGIDRGYGFSGTGKTFVFATSSDLQIWNFTT